MVRGTEQHNGRAVETCWDAELGPGQYQGGTRAPSTCELMQAYEL